MKRAVTVASYVIVALIGFMPLSVYAVSGNSVVIREVYVGGPTDASDEYIVLHNNAETAVDLASLEIEYKSATGKSWVRKAVVNEAKSLEAHADMIFATKRAHDVELIDGLAQAGGNLHIVQNNLVLDQVAWGTGDSPEETAIPAQNAGVVLERVCDNSSGKCADTDNNAQDFTSKVIDTPQPTGPGGAPGKGGDTGQPIVTTEDYAIEITELLPDPASPQTDAKDEYVELYNAGSGMAALVGWKLSDGKHIYRLDSVTIEPGRYVALYARDTKLALNNDGDQVSLLRPSGETEFITPNYSKAKSGMSFGATADGWGWLESLTPGAANAGLSQSANNDNTTAKAKSAKATKTTSTKKATKAASAKTGSLAKGGQGGNASDGGAAEDRPSTPWAWILAGLGTLTVGYGAYEYRPEILSFFTKLRAKFGAGK